MDENTNFINFTLKCDILELIKLPQVDFIKEINILFTINQAKLCVLGRKEL
jgi:hypothetical protein